MMQFRPADTRGHANFGWLDSRHSFSFGRYYDPAHMGFGPLRVINEDRVAPGGGFDPHAHADMEIISYVLDGGLEHRDSLGNGAVVRPGDVQRMTAGRGIRHSEFNASREDPVHFLQIWIMPEKAGLEPGYEQTHFTEAERRGRLRLVGSNDGRDGSVTIHQDVNLYAGLFDSGDGDEIVVGAGREVWVQVVRGDIEVENGQGETQAMTVGDGLGLTDPGRVRLTAQADTEVLVFDMAPLN